MKKTLPLAPAPTVASDDAAAEYFASHSVAGVWDQLPAASSGKLSRTLTKSVDERRSARKTPISIRLDPSRSSPPKESQAPNRSDIIRNFECGCRRNSQGGKKRAVAVRPRGLPHRRGLARPCGG